VQAGDGVFVQSPTNRMDNVRSIIMMLSGVTSLVLIAGRLGAF
jgi:hypothetical protein